MMRYVARMTFFYDPQYWPYDRIREILQRRGLDELVFSNDNGYGITTLILEKSDPRYPALATAVEELKTIGPLVAGISYEPKFEPGDIERSELLVLRVGVHCGHSFRELAEQRGLPSGTLVIDKHKIRKKDIAITYGFFEMVISDRLRWILQEEALSGWLTYPVEHRNAKAKNYPRLHHLVGANELPPVSAEMELQRFHYTNPRDNLYGTVALMPADPLTYRKGDLAKIEDFNRTKEQWGDEPVKHPLTIISQRAWSVFTKHKIKRVHVEPVLIV